MLKMVPILSFAAFLSAVLTMVSDLRGPRWGIYLFKPLTMLLIIATGLQKASSVPPFYKLMIIAGLVCSLAGDIFLMLPSDRFIAGLVSFLVAHVLYICAFSLGGNLKFPLVSILPFIVYGAFMLRLLWNHLGRLKAPVLVYMAAILLMGVQAANRWLFTSRLSAMLAFYGAILFILSDSVLAFNRFKRPLRSANLYILSTYFAAQWLIALSV